MIKCLSHSLFTVVAKLHTEQMYIPKIKIDKKGYDNVYETCSGTASTAMRRTRWTVASICGCDRGECVIEVNGASPAQLRF